LFRNCYARQHLFKSKPTLPSALLPYSCWAYCHCLTIFHPVKYNKMDLFIMSIVFYLSLILLYPWNVSLRKMSIFICFVILSKSSACNNTWHILQVQ
jgi:hypothetical protein